MEGESLLHEDLWPLIHIVPSCSLAWLMNQEIVQELGKHVIIKTTEALSWMKMVEFPASNYRGVVVLVRGNKNSQESCKTLTNSLGKDFIHFIRYGRLLRTNNWTFIVQRGGGESKHLERTQKTSSATRNMPASLSQIRKFECNTSPRSELLHQFPPWVYFWPLC